VHARRVQTSKANRHLFNDMPTFLLRQWRVRMILLIFSVDGVLGDELLEAYIPECIIIGGYVCAGGDQRGRGGESVYLGWGDVPAAAVFEKVRRRGVQPPPGDESLWAEVDVSLRPATRDDGEEIFTEAMRSSRPGYRTHRDSTILVRAFAVFRMAVPGAA